MWIMQLNSAKLVAIVQWARFMHFKWQTYEQKSAYSVHKIQYIYVFYVQNSLISAH